MEERKYRDPIAEDDKTEIFDERQKILRVEITAATMTLCVIVMFFNTMIMEFGAQWATQTGASMIIICLFCGISLIYCSVKGVMFGVNAAIVRSPLKALGTLGLIAINCFINIYNSHFVFIKDNILTTAGAMLIVFPFMTFCVVFSILWYKLRGRKEEEE